MPTLRFSINSRTSEAIAQAAKEKITELVVEKARENFKAAKSDIAKVVDDEIENHKYNFMPNNEEAYELGIGSDGQVDEGRIEEAWRTLQIGSGRGVTTLTTRKGEGKTGLGNIQVNIDYLEFYNQPECRIDTPDSDKIDEIPWMQWFIEGQVISDWHFFGTKNSKTSRTGGGIMIQGGFWKFRPRTEAVNLMQVGISAAVNAFITRFVAKEILD
jgi:hypothetical protein